MVAATVTAGVLALLAWTLGQWRRTRLAHVRTLEEQKDAADLPEASGDAIAREFERYLRRKDAG